MAWGRSTDGREFHRKHDGLHRISSCLMCFLVLYRFIFDCTLNLALLGELDQVFASYLGESTTPMWLVFNWVESTTTARWVTFGRCWRWAEGRRGRKGERRHRWQICDSKRCVCHRVTCHNQRPNEKRSSNKPYGRGLHWCRRDVHLESLCQREEEFIGGIDETSPGIRCTRIGIPEWP